MKRRQRSSTLEASSRTHLANSQDLSHGRARCDALAPTRAAASHRQPHLQRVSQQAPALMLWKPGAWVGPVPVTAVGDSQQNRSSRAHSQQPSDLQLARHASSTACKTCSVPARCKPDAAASGTSVSSGCRMPPNSVLPRLPHIRAHVQHERLHCASVQTAQNRSAGCACPKRWRQWSSEGTAQAHWRARSLLAQVNHGSSALLCCCAVTLHRVAAVHTDLMLEGNLQSGALLCCSL